MTWVVRAVHARGQAPKHGVALTPADARMPLALCSPHTFLFTHAHSAPPPHTHTHARTQPLPPQSLCAVRVRAPTSHAATTQPPRWLQWSSSSASATRPSHLTRSRPHTGAWSLKVPSQAGIGLPRSCMRACMGAAWDPMGSSEQISAWPMPRTGAGRCRNFRRFSRMPSAGCLWPRPYCGGHAWGSCATQPSSWPRCRGRMHMQLHQAACSA